MRAQVRVAGLARRANWGLLEEEEALTCNIMNPRQMNGYFLFARAISLLAVIADWFTNWISGYEIGI